ncbi:hypothetical protein [Citrifermentans bremense]|nr:hypothetical protein [Citrifermentans bremense]
MSFDKTVKCPACGFVAGDAFEECPKCGVVIRKYHQKQVERERLVRTAKEEAQQRKARNEKLTSGLKGAAQGMKLGALFGIGFFSVGLVVCLIPVIGWVLGPFLMVTGIAAPFFVGAFGVKGGVDSAGSTILRGPCPYCTGLVDVTILASQKNKVVGTDCPVCRKRFVIKGTTFYAV